jgi:FkbM family methyltransferase
MPTSVFRATKKFTYHLCRAISEQATKVKVKFGPSLLVSDRYGSKFWVNKNNALDVLVDSPEGFDDGLPYVVSNFTPRLGVAIDIGANAGYYTIPLAAQFRQVIAFEPLEGVFNKLKVNINLNQLTNVDLHQAAISNFSGKARFFAQESVDGDLNLNLGLSSLIRRDQYFKSEIEVNVVSLDDFLKDFDVDFIKVDVEGSELQVFQGAIRMIRASKPVILWEASSNLSKVNVMNCYDFLASMGYASYLVKAGNKKTIISREDLAELDFDVNVLSTATEISAG